MTPEDERQFQSATICHICDRAIGKVKYRDHCYLTEEYRGAAHEICNLNYKITTQLQKVDVIAQHKERSVSFSKHIQVDEVEVNGNKKQLYLKIRFFDSFHFMASSLDSFSHGKPRR